MDDNKTIYDYLSEITDITIGYTTFKDFLITLVVASCHEKKTQDVDVFASDYAFVTEVTPLTKKASGCPLFYGKCINSNKDTLMYFHKIKEKALDCYNQKTILPFFSLNMPHFENFCKWDDNMFTAPYLNLDEAAQNAEIYCALVGKNIIFKYNDVEMEVSPDLTWRKIINKYKKLKGV